MEQLLSALPALPALPYLSALPIPPWAAGAGVLVVLILLITLVWIIGFRRLLRFTFTYGLFIALLGGAYLAFREYEDINQRKFLEERANALFTKTIQPGSAFACIDGSASPAMQDACERTLFSEPQQVATSVAITTQRVAYLIDATRFASSRDRSYQSRIVPLRKTLESDPYGFVGFVLSSVYHCMAELCDKFDIFDDAERVRENIRSRRYEAYMAKYAGVWRGEPLREDKKESDVILPGVAVGDRPRNLIPLDAGPPALFDAVPRGNPIPSGPVLLQHTTPPVTATPPDVTPPPTVGQPRPRVQAPQPVATPASAPAAKQQDTPFRSIVDEPDDAKGQKKAAPKAEPKPEAKAEAKPAPKAEAKAEAKSEQKKSASTKGEPKGSVYQMRKGNEPVGGLPRLVPGDYKRPDPNAPVDTPIPQGVIMPN